MYFTLQDKERKEFRMNEMLKLKTLQQSTLTSLLRTNSDAAANLWLLACFQFLKDFQKKSLKHEREDFVTRRTFWKPVDLQDEIIFGPMISYVRSFLNKTPAFTRKTRNESCTTVWNCCCVYVVVKGARARPPECQFYKGKLPMHSLHFDLVVPLTITKANARRVSNGISPFHLPQRIY